MQKTHIAKFDLIYPINVEHLHSHSRRRARPSSPTAQMPFGAMQAACEIGFGDTKVVMFD